MAGYSAGMMEWIVVGAGKGGVGKSTVTCQLALSLKEMGKRVGVLDADVYGPSLDELIPFDEPPRREGDRLIPAMGQGIKLMSVAYFQQGAALVRAPIANQTIERFMKEVDWGDLDYVLVDLPPGTGDVVIEVLQQAPVAGAVLVTTPQELALIDVRKAHQGFVQTKIPVLGLVENMSYFKVGQDRVYPFGEGGGERLVRELDVPLLEKVPMRPNPADGEEWCHLASKVEKRLQEVSLRGMEKFFVDGGKELVIEWTDGHLSRYDLSHVQQLCPCARCSNGPKAIRGDLSARQAQRVGRYGIKIEFSSGCSSGVYTYDLLRGSEG